MLPLRINRMNIIRRLFVRPLHSVNAVGQVAGVYRQCAMALRKWAGDGMELSYFQPRSDSDVAAAVGLSHNMLDGALFLGVCDKIVPLAMAALFLGHLPAIFVPSGPI